MERKVIHGIYKRPTYDSQEKERKNCVISGSEKVHYLYDSMTQR